MAAITSTIGLAIAAAGVGVSVFSAASQAKYAKKSLAAQREAENLRRQQMNLDAVRRRREIARNAQVAQAQSLTTATNQGAAGSGPEGALAGIAGQANTALAGSLQAQDLGNRIFDANEKGSYAQAGAAQAGMWGSIGGALGSLGQGMIKQHETIGNVWRNIFQPQGSY